MYAPCRRYRQLPAILVQRRPQTVAGRREIALVAAGNYRLPDGPLVVERRRRVPCLVGPRDQGVSSAGLRVGRTVVQRHRWSRVGGDDPGGGGIVGIGRPPVAAGHAGGDGEYLAGRTEGGNRGLRRVQHVNVADAEERRRCRGGEDVVHGIPVAPVEMKREALAVQPVNLAHDDARAPLAEDARVIIDYLQGSKPGLIAVDREAVGGLARREIVIPAIDGRNRLAAQGEARSAEAPNAGDVVVSACRQVARAVIELDAAGRGPASRGDRADRRGEADLVAIAWIAAVRRVGSVATLAVVVVLAGLTVWSYSPTMPPTNVALSLVYVPTMESSMASGFERVQVAQPLVSSVMDRSGPWPHRRHHGAGRVAKLAVRCAYRGVERDRLAVPAVRREGELTATVVATEVAAGALAPESCPPASCTGLSPKAVATFKMSPSRWSGR